MTDVYEKIRSVEFGKLPEPVQKVYLAPPVISVPVKQKGNVLLKIVMKNSRMKI